MKSLPLPCRRCLLFISQSFLNHDHKVAHNALRTPSSQRRHRLGVRADLATEADVAYIYAGSLLVQEVGAATGRRRRAAWCTKRGAEYEVCTQDVLASAEGGHARRRAGQAEGGGRARGGPCLNTRSVRGRDRHHVRCVRWQERPFNCGRRRLRVGDAAGELVGVPPRWPEGC